MNLPGLALNEEGDQEDPSPPDEPILSRASKLRLPERDPALSKPEKVAVLEQHVWECAVVRGQLAELRLNANVELKVAEDKWDAMQVVPATSKVSLTETKRRHNPALALLMKNAKWTSQRCNEEINRLDHDQEAASRLYTLIMGS